MSFRVRGSRVFLTLACMSVASCFAQPAVIETLFDTLPGKGRSEKRSLVLNTTASRALAKKPGSVTLKNFPLAHGQSANFELSPARIFESDAKIVVVGENGRTKELPLPAAQAWYGRDLTGGQRSLFMVARSDGTLSAMVTGDAASSDTVVMPDESGVVYSAEAATLPDRELCSTADEIVAGSTTEESHETHEGHSHAEEPATAALGTGTRQLDLMLDVSYPTYQKLGSNTAMVNDYVTQLMGAVGSIYRRDLDVEVKVSSLYIWTTPDPFNNPGSDNVLSSGDQLNNYQDYLIANRGSISRDLAHLVNYNTGLGGIAYVDTLCRNDYGIGVSNVYAALNFPTDTNTYYWDTMVVSHEMGHNVGSQHTHCYSPPIDCCYVQSGCSGCSTAAPAAGTIMSYCHLQFGRGGSIAMNFHPRCVELMRARIDAAGCLTAFTGSANMQVSGKSGTVIAAGDFTPAFADGTDYSSTKVGSAPVTQAFTITNSGSKDLAISGQVALTGSSYFQVTRQPATLITPAQSTSFEVTFNPAVMGTYDARVVLLSNDPARPRYEFAISAKASKRGTPKKFLYTGSAAIPDGNQNGVYIPITVSDVGGGLMDIDFAIEGTGCTDPNYVGLQHAYVGDLRLVLESPSGTRVTLMDRPGAGTFGSSGKNFCGTILDDESGGPSIESISPSGTGQLASPHTGAFTPFQPLSTFYGENANGVWKIHAVDLQSPDPGILRAAALTVTGSESSISSGVNDWMNY